MKRFLLIKIYLLAFIVPNVVFSQNVAITGTVADKISGERLPGATIRVGKGGTVSNEYGFFSLPLKVSSYELEVSYVGYLPLHLSVDLKRDTILSLSLTPSGMIGEVQVREAPIGLLQGKSQGNYSLTSKQISQLPVLLGEADVVKAVQLLPGVQACNEASGSLMVRGGGSDGNLIVLDDVPIFNVSHLWGLFSLFDPDVLKSVQFYNSGFPSKYGGRSSSVLDLRLKDGNLYEYHGNVSVGIASSKIFVEGPIKKEKSSFLFSARRTYIDLPLSIYQSIKYSDYEKYHKGYYFYDLIGKVSWNVGSKDRLFFSVYTGRDKSYMEEKKDTLTDDDATLQWGNLTTAVRWNHIWSARLFSNVTATYTKYRYYAYHSNLQADLLSYKKNQFDYQSSIKDFSVKADASYYPSEKLKIEYGIYASKKYYDTGASDYLVQRSRDSADCSVMDYSTPLYQSVEYGGYVSGNATIGNLLYPVVGARGTSYRQGNKTFYYVEPRFSLGVKKESIPLEATVSYSMMHQPIQLLSNYGISLPIDLWVPSTEKVVPVSCNEYSAGFTYRAGKGYRVIVESYIKQLSHLIDYKTGKAFSPTDLNWEEKIVVGEGRSKGVELLVEKGAGKLTGWITYTLSKTERRFDGINKGAWYPSTYDHRHEIKIMANYRFPGGIVVNGVWIFGTGGAVTLPRSKYYMTNGTLIDYSDSPLFIYGERNGYRMPDYHRLDLGISIPKQLKHGKRTLSMGIYNVYNRKNPYYLSYETNYTPARFKTNSLLPFIPYITYSYEF